MKFSTQFFIFCFIIQLLKSHSINLTPTDEAQYGSYFLDKSNILTVTPNEYQLETKSEKLPKKNPNQENYLDPNFKAVLQDISDNSHYLASETKDETKLLSKSQDYQKSIEDSVDNQMNEIEKESREEGFKRKNQEMAELYLPEISQRSNKNQLKAPRFLQKNEEIYSNDENIETDDNQHIYDPTEAGML